MRVELGLPDDLQNEEFKKEYSINITANELNFD
jgi:hypothetical protein